MAMQIGFGAVMTTVFYFWNVCTDDIICIFRKALWNFQHDVDYFSTYMEISKNLKKLQIKTWLSSLDIRDYIRNIILKDLRTVSYHLSRLIKNDVQNTIWLKVYPCECKAIHDIREEYHLNSMSVTQNKDFAINMNWKLQAHFYMQELRANPLKTEYYLPLLPPSDPPTIIKEEVTYKSEENGENQDTSKKFNMFTSIQHVHIKDNVGYFNFLHKITTASDKTEGKLVETIPSLSNQNNMPITQKELDTREQPLSESPETAIGNDILEASIQTHNSSAASGASESHSTSDIGQEHGTSEEKMSALVSYVQCDDLLKKFKYTVVSSEKRSSLMGKSDAVNKRIENRHFLGANVEFKLQTRNCHYEVGDINLKSTVNNVGIYRAVMENETNRMMESIDTLETVTFDLLGTERKRIFFDLLEHSLLHSESSATISDFIPDMFDPTVIQEVIYLSTHELSMINRLKTLLLSCPDGERLRQRSQQEFISLILTAVAATFNESTTRRPMFFMVDSEVFKRALEGISQDSANNPQPEEKAVVPGVDNARQKGNGNSETIESRPVQCIYFPSDCRLFIYIPTESGSYWDQLDMQRASRLNLTSPAVTNP